MELETIIDPANQIITVRNVPKDLINEYNKILLFYHGKIGDYSFVIIDKGISIENDLRFPVRIIKLLEPQISEQVPPEPPFYKIGYYLKDKVEELGKGVYGQVYKSGKYAIKTFLTDTYVDNPYLDPSFLRETSVLRHLNHPNIVNLIDIVSGSPERPDDNLVSIVLPLADYNLHDYLKIHGNSQRRLMVFNILKGFDYLQKKDIVHGDIKPDNILVYLINNDPNNFRVVISDFGLSVPTSCRINYLKGSPYIPYFRSPEILFDMGYGLPADLWAIGCLIYYVYTKKYIFHQPGDIIDPKNEGNLLELIKQRMFKTMGSPEDPKYGWTELYHLLLSKGLIYTFVRDTSELRKNVNNDDMFDIIMDLLQYNPHKRVSIGEILKRNIFGLFPSFIQDQGVDCPGIIDQRQKYSIIINSKDIRGTISDKLYNNLKKSGYDIKDYFNIMYLFDYACPINNDIEESMLYYIACIETYYFYKYNRGFRRPFKIPVNDPGYDVEYAIMVDKVIPKILHIIGFDLIYTTMANYIPDTLVPQGIKAVEDETVTKYLASDITDFLISKYY